MTIGTLQPSFFDHTSLGLALAFLIAMAVAGGVLWMLWKLQH